MKLKRVAVRFLPCAIVLLAIVGNPMRAQNAASKSDEYSNFFELNFFGGYEDYAHERNAFNTKITGGPVIGVRLSEDFWNYLALEEDIASFSWQHLDFPPITPAVGSQAVQPPQFQTRGYQASLNGVLHFTPRDSKLRPFVTVGVGGDRYAPTGGAQNLAQSLPPALGLNGLRPDGGFQANYGGGVKYQFDQHVGLRFDVRGLIGRAPASDL